MRSALFTLLFTLFSVTAASAQLVKLNKGDFEISTFGQFTDARKELDLRFGAFVMDYTQIGINFTVLDDRRADRLALSVFGLYLFETRTYVLPYLGGSFGFGRLAAGDSKDNSGIEIAFIGGLKYYLRENVALNTEVQFGLSSEDTFLGNRTSESSEVSLRLGISYLW